MGYTTAVTGMSATIVSQKAAHSHPPRWGMAIKGPYPSARARSMCSKPS